MQDFGFRNAIGKEFWTLRGDVTNGASIPRIGWSLIGSPFTGRYRLATAIHDGEYIHAQEAGHTKDMVDDAMREAMLFEGAHRVKAWAMYSAVKYTKAAKDAWLSVDETAIDELVI